MDHINRIFGTNRSHFLFEAQIPHNILQEINLKFTIGHERYNTL